MTSMFACLNLYSYCHNVGYSCRFTIFAWQAYLRSHRTLTGHCLLLFCLCCLNMCITWFEIWTANYWKGFFVCKTTTITTTTVLQPLDFVRDYPGEPVPERYQEGKTNLDLLDWIEQGLTSHQTHYRSYRGRVFTGQMTQPTVSKHWRKIGPKD